MVEFVWNEKEQTHFQKDNLNGWCVCEGITVCGTKTEYQVSDGIERSESYDFSSLYDAMKECIRLNKEESLEEES
mgnify:CR=1 FL=1